MVPVRDLAGVHGDVPVDPMSSLLLRLDLGLRVLGAAEVVRRDSGVRGVFRSGEINISM